ncbi:hypothetical protein [Thiohalophilus thiocyanatoxydans]|uniref:Uncharacterized protein n=1 Tax=Thiohalophilus thiocyanatoxydans TaxID=381308 RepID=A0A4R8ITG5_9GAMM|nr:hypothetical protein [Thiohalophilus thiocyanatoxydans]TDY02700.1 hypothetical protein EDC23_1077 [Thiohalophilus thiocyanatoxydans]
MSNLAFPYTWSNPNASEQALLANALLRPRFADLVTLTNRFGEEALLATLERLGANGEIPKPVTDELRGMLANISKGIHEHRRTHAPQPQ